LSTVFFQIFIPPAGIKPLRAAHTIDCTQFVRKEVRRMPQNNASNQKENRKPAQTSSQKNTQNQAGNQKESRRQEDDR